LDESLPEVLPFVDVAFVNGAAAESLGGAHDASRFLQERGARTVVATLGELGALLRSADHETHEIAAWDVEAIDTNGAGDAFAGGFAAARLKGLDELQAAEVGAFIAGRSTTVYGGFGIDRPLAEIREDARVGGASWWERL
jgi:sugar/nucleoside kinase (ribokinase family)